MGMKRSGRFLVKNHYKILNRCDTVTSWSQEEHPDVFSNLMIFYYFKLPIRPYEVLSKPTQVKIVQDKENGKLVRVGSLAI